MSDYQEKAVADSILKQCYGLQQCQPEVSNAFFGFKGDTKLDYFVFAQVGCEQDEEMLYLKNLMGLAVSVIGLFICMFFRAQIILYQGTNIINDKIFDQHLITLGDYSMMAQVKEAQYNSFYAKLTTHDQRQNAVREFEKYLASTIKERLAKSDKDAGKDPEIYEVAEKEWKYHIAKLAWENIRGEFGGKVIECFQLFMNGKNVDEVCKELNIKKNSAFVFRKRVQERFSKEIRRLDYDLS